MKIIAVILFSLMCLGMNAQITTYNINRNMSCSDTVRPFYGNTRSFGISVDGNGQLLSDTAFIRVVLVDNNNHEWLVYERNRLYATEENIQFQGAAFETSVLYDIAPKYLIVTLCDATLYLSNAKSNQIVKDRNTVAAMSDSIFHSKNLQIVERINSKLSAHKKAWRADTTFLSNLRYHDKKAIFGDVLPNLQGWDYYAYGYYSPLDDNTPPASDNIVKEFDWCTRHGSLNSDSYYFNPDGSGWIPRKRYGQEAAECWAFASQYSTESMVNLYFNRQLNDELSVQDIISCSGAGTWDSGGSVKDALTYIAEEGVVCEACFPFYPRQTIPCESSYKCENPNEIVSFARRSEYFGGEDTIKKNLITKGVLTCRLKTWGHAMSLVGFGVVKAGDPILYGNTHGSTDHDVYVTYDSPDIGKPYYIFKQSYAEYGYDRSPFCKVIIDANRCDTATIQGVTYIVYKFDAFSIEVPVTSQLFNDSDIACLDIDNDGYYNWGIGPKPATCPNCPDEKDSDDSSPLIGPYNEKYESVILCDNYVYSTIPEYITDNVFWGSEKYLNHDVIIEHGGTLTIKNTVYFGESSKIIVKPGGRLILDYRAILTGMCETMWPGIQVWGNRNMHQQEINGSYAQGYLEMKNGAIIENAECAVTLWHPDDYNSTGGIIHATNSTFRNNAMAVRAIWYDNYNPNTGSPRSYNARFRNCDFIIDSAYLGTTTFYRHVDLAYVKGISFYGCRFSVSRFIPGVSLWCDGIRGSQASFKIESFCTGDLLPCIGDNLVRSSFSGFHTGVYASNDGSGARTFMVRNSDFLNNDRGIYALDTDYATILDNNFSIGCGAECTFGIYTDHVSGFCIENNTFSPWHKQNCPAFGVAVVSSCSTYEVYLNQFSGLMCANVAIGQNFQTESGGLPSSPQGLTYSCNDNTWDEPNTIDFCVVEDGSTSYSGIQQAQGSSFSPSGNTFGGSFFHFYNDGDFVVNYYYKQNQSNQIPSLVNNVSLNGTNSTNNCQPHYGDIQVLRTTQEKEELEDAYLAAHTTYQSLKQIYESRIDGGSTSAEVSDITNATSSDMWRLRAKLLGHSPYLSNEVLTAAADRDNVFTHSVLFEILSANPDELKKDTLISYLENKVNPLPDYMIGLLRMMADGATARTALEAQMTKYAHDYRLAAGDIVRSNLNDSIANPTELRTWLATMEDIAADRMIIASLMQEGNYTDALALANMLPNLYELQGDQLADHVDYMRLLNLYNTLQTTNRTVFELTETETEMVEEIADEGMGTSRSMAEALLSSLTENRGDRLYFCPSIPKPKDGGKGVKTSFNTMLNEALGFDVNISPSPASTWVSVDYTLPVGAERATLTLTSMLGVKVMEVEISGNRGSKVLDLRGLSDGVYGYTIRCGGNAKNGKIVIAK